MLSLNADAADIAEELASSSKTSSSFFVWLKSGGSKLVSLFAILHAVCGLRKK